MHIQALYDMCLIEQCMNLHKPYPYYNAYNNPPRMAV